MSILSFICGLTGCKKTPDHTADDIRVVSVSCSHMDFCFGYSFSLTLSENGALLSAECFTDRESERVEIEDIPISKEDADGLIDIIRVDACEQRIDGSFLRTCRKIRSLRFDKVRPKRLRTGRVL